MFSGKPITTEVKTLNTGPARKVSVQSLLLPMLIMGFCCKQWKKIMAMACFCLLAPTSSPPVKSGYKLCPYQPTRVLLPKA